jgi:hypothetical protein
VSGSKAFEVKEVVKMGKPLELTVDLNTGSTTLYRRKRERNNER